MAHPILAWKANFSKKTMEEWENKTSQFTQSKEEAFRKELFTKVMGAKPDEVKQLKDGVNKKQGQKFLEEIYDKVESGESR